MKTRCERAGRWAAIWRAGSNSSQCGRGSLRKSRTCSIRPRFRSENQFHRQLQLPRRSGIARGETRIADLPEGVALVRGDYPVRLAEVGVVEKIERVHSELQRDPLEDLRVLNQRKIDV